MQFNDVNTNSELRIYLDDIIIGYAPKGRDNSWVGETLGLEGVKKPKLVELTVETTKNKDRWTSRITGWR